MTDITWTNDTRKLSDLVPWERNPKRMTKKQAEGLRLSIERFGFAVPFLVSPDGDIYDGHQRQALMGAIKEHGPNATVDVRVSSRPLDDDERRELVVRLKQNQAGWDFDMLPNLYEREELLEWGFEPAELGLDGTDPADDPPEDLTRWDVPDAIFPTDNDLGIPLLDASLQAQMIIAPVQAWGMGAGARSRTNPGLWHFYTEDYRFDALWSDPSPVINSGCQVVVEPNFSAYTEMPRVVALWSIYRKRWLARWWQSFGVRVLVDLNVAEPHYLDNLLGVPVGWRSWATRGYVDRIENTVLEYDMACSHAGTSDILFFVYGGGRAVKELCTQRGWVHAIEQRDAAKAV